MTQWYTTAAAKALVVNLQHLSSRPCSLLKMSTNSTTTTTTTTNTNVVDDIFKQKRILRTHVKKTLKAIDPSLRSQQEHIMTICSGKKLYVPRVEDRNSHMRMLNISRIDDLVANSMDILEPAPVDADGNAREDVMQANDPVDLFLLPGLAFDRSGRRLGRGGGYYDTFLENYQNLAKTRNWKQPLLVALSYSEQILDDGVIPVTSSDVPIDALVSPEGVIPITATALNRFQNE